MVGTMMVTFEVDTGVDVTVLSATEYSAQAMGALCDSEEQLLGAGRRPIKTLGKVIAQIKWNDRTIHDTVFVAEGVKSALLGRPAIQALNVLLSLNEVGMTNKPNQEIPMKDASLLQGNHERMKTEYSIALHPDAKPFAISCPRRVPIPLLLAVRQEIQEWKISGSSKGLNR